MPPPELYRHLYDYEKDCDGKMLAMLASVSLANRADARFSQAVTLAAHLAACRENWLARITGDGPPQADWFDSAADFAAMEPRFAALHDRWTEYLARLDADNLAREFAFTEGGGETFRLPVEVQIVQLIGHANYHRGQIALLVTQLGGETPDTDYADWWWAQHDASP